MLDICVGEIQQYGVREIAKVWVIRLGNVGGKLAGSLIRNGCDLVLRDIGLFQDIATAHNVPLEISPILIKIFKDGQTWFGARE